MIREKKNGLTSFEAKPLFMSPVQSGILSLQCS